MSWNDLDWPQIFEAFNDTLYMVGYSLLFTVLIGLPVGVVLYLTRPAQLLENRALYQSLSLIVNVLRSTPFVILLIVMVPLTRFLVGTPIEAIGMVPPLTASAAPFFARLVETTLKELDNGISEASRAMGANAYETVVMALLPEAKTGIIAAVVVTAILLVGYSAMSGVVGGGGLGELAIRIGYHRNKKELMWVMALILVALVQITQLLGDYWIARINRRIS